jgi:hypothetical protein
MSEIYILPGDLIRAVHWAIVWTGLFLDKNGDWSCGVKKDPKEVLPGTVGIAISVERQEEGVYPYVYCLFPHTIGWSELFEDQISHLNEELSSEALEYLAGIKS